MERKAPDQASTKSIAGSNMFTFVVGDDATEYTIHTALVAKQPPALNVLVNGPFKEALDCRVQWADLEENIFLSFWKFAYSGNYTNPIQEDEGKEESDRANEELSHWGKAWAHYVRHYPVFSDPNSRNAPGLNGLWQDFVDKHAPIPRPSDEGSISADTLLHHAQVCVFADRYCMDRLMDVSLEKLFIALEATIPWGDSWDAVMELLVLASGKIVPVRLQEIVAEYILSQAELFKNEEVFRDFIPSEQHLSFPFNMIPLEDRFRMQKARESGEFTDFAFVCEGQTINVHKIIICGQSTVFQRVCTGKFKEASSGIYDMNDHPLDVVNRMVEYLYTGTYEIPDGTDLFTHVSMFTLADKYGINGLQALASRKYLECLDESCNYHDFASSISQVYKLPKETSKTLRAGALVMARKNLGTALSATELGIVIDEFLYDCPEFARDLLSLSLRFSRMGTCSNSGCESRSAVPIEILQCRCEKCGKGGASAGLSLRSWSKILEYELDMDEEDVKLGKNVLNADCTSDFKEARSGAYDLSEYPMESVEMMVDYFYVGHYEYPSLDASKLSLATHMSMMALADKYDIKGLGCEAKSLYIRRLKQKNIELEDFLNSLPVLYEMLTSVSKDAIDAAVTPTRETVLPCTCREANEGVIDQISDASQDFLKEVMISIMSTPLESRCGDCSKPSRSLRITEEIRAGNPFSTDQPDAEHSPFPYRGRWVLMPG
ncbi:hypothetical protein FAGAP_8833 [Fusarium agapanthi]|uniref:BTB domain-containing protein n=1 Tax=Fusarium agapanthi TaxID=1803897 RepID=A0A9P5EBW3_9HYPO|nr:hypothetical protein FAGAP_8833 [Fusarium agapanthi]